MKTYLSSRIYQLALPGFLVMGLLLSAPAAFAQAVEGCNPAVLDAMQTTSDARTAASNSVDDAIFDQDDSVLALTCFNQAAAISGYQGGQIFSGDFVPSLQPVIEDALTAMYDDFPDSVGNKTNIVNYGAIPLPAGNGPFTCDEAANLWSQVESMGVNPGVPFSTFQDLVNGGAPGAGAPPTVGGAPADPDYNTNWNTAADQGVFQNMQTAVNNLPAPAVQSFAGAQTPCDVMLQMGAVATCP
ncbi:MAG: hypothetical protein OXT65_12760 [Alphaproteobacteria bacterium]|nr:hypothetical protein [Alphaproteobacteria bacterium]